MSSCCRDLTCQFDARVAERDARRLERDGPIPTTGMLVEDLASAGVEGCVVMDVGGGPGAVQEGLLDAGARRAISVEASEAFTKVARERARERGYADQVDYRSGDFVALVPELPRADVVALDRVVCCYPDLEGMLEAAASRARRLVGAVYPRHRLAVRAVVGLQNLWRRLTGNPFRVYVYPVEAIVAGLEDRGLRPLSRRRTFVWEVAVFARDDAAGERG